MWPMIKKKVAKNLTINKAAPTNDVCLFSLRLLYIRSCM